MRGDHSGGRPSRSTAAGPPPRARGPQTLTCDFVPSGSAFYSLPQIPANTAYAAEATPHHPLQPHRRAYPLSPRSRRPEQHTHPQGQLHHNPPGHRSSRAPSTRASIRAARPVATLKAPAARPVARTRGSTCDGWGPRRHQGTPRQGSGMPVMCRPIAWCRICGSGWRRSRGPTRGRTRHSSHSPPLLKTRHPPLTVNPTPPTSTTSLHQYGPGRGRLRPTARWADGPRPAYCPPPCTDSPQAGVVYRRSENSVASGTEGARGAQMRQKPDRG